MHLPGRETARRIVAAGAAVVACVLAGCAALPEAPAGPPSAARVAPADGTLARLATAAGLPAEGSAFRPLLASRSALTARLALIERAETGIDIQTYILGDDATGRQVMRALRDAAARGVRVRLLVDDMHTVGLTDLLLGLAAHANVEVRLYNPFPAGRDSWALRALGAIGNLERLNRRMHNKLFVVDGRVAIVGGRNLADPYFLRHDEANFIDFDVVAAGAVAAELGGHFDRYWNSRFAVPVQALADNRLDDAARRASFDRLTADATDAVPPGTDLFGASAPGPLVPAPVEVFFDSVDKTAGVPGTAGRLPVARLLAEAQSNVIVVSPYFVPSEAGIERLRAARARGVELQVITNALDASDEPLVQAAYGRKRAALLRSGIRLFELSAERVQRRIGAGSPGRLHAKIAFVDGRRLLVGSMNLDPRSVNTNTELALSIDSPELTRDVLHQLQPARVGGLYEVNLSADGERLLWVAQGDVGAPERRDDEPAPPWWTRLRLWLLSWLVPDELL